MKVPFTKPDGKQTWLLLLAMGFMELGVAAFIPVFPLFMKGLGAKDSFVGIVIAGGILGSALSHFPAGWVADKLDKKKAALASIAAYCLFFGVYLLPLPKEALMPARFFHGALGGFFLTTAQSLLAELTASRNRAEAYGQAQAAVAAGWLVGPVIGGIIGGFWLGGVFLASAFSCLLGTACLAFMASKPGERGKAAAPPRIPTKALALRLVPVLLASAGISYATGTYEAVWSLYLSKWGATPLLIGASYALYFIPAILFSRAAGKFADKAGPRLVVGAMILFTAVMAIAYSLAHNVWILLAIGTVEGILVLGGIPALDAATSRVGEGTAQGKAQGIYQTSSTGMTALGALAGGLLFGVSMSYAFLGIAFVCLVSFPGVFFLGRAHEAEAPPLFWTRSSLGE